MFRSKSDDSSGLEKTLDLLFEEMSSIACDSDEFAKMADQASKLYPLKEVDSKKRVSPDVLATVLANLAGIVVIVGHERMHVVTSKALTLLRQQFR
jgi:hypothetical protein